MDITLCDCCKETIKGEEKIETFYGYTFEFCSDRCINAFQKILNQASENFSSYINDNNITPLKIGRVIRK
ncbi:unnamed protein product [marine sediment metagenome]|uniref:TRASH domain-containing protein n=1 Tax=marine sediment metagenome TaxID=412755 RepID=X1F5R5_9ZZZZ